MLLVAFALAFTTVSVPRFVVETDNFPFINTISTGQTTHSFLTRWNNYRSKCTKFDENKKITQKCFTVILKMRGITVSRRCVNYPY